MIGIYRLLIDYIKIDTGLTEEVIRDTLKILREAEFAFYDEEAKTVYVPSFAEIQIAPSLKPTDSRIRAIQREVDKSLHCEFKKRFLERYGELYHLRPLDGAGDGGSGGPQRGVDGGSTPPKSASEGQKTGDKSLEAVDNYGGSTGRQRPFDTVPDSVPEGVKRGLGREEDGTGMVGERRRPVTKMEDYILNWPAEMAKKTRH
jgi:hypothetical protein